MKSIPERARVYFRDLCLYISAHKAWILTPMLVAVIFAILTVMHLMRYHKTEFIYSLF